MEVTLMSYPAINSRQDQVPLEFENPIKRELEDIARDLSSYSSITSPRLPQYRVYLYPSISSAFGFDYSIYSEVVTAGMVYQDVVDHAWSHFVGEVWDFEDDQVSNEQEVTGHEAFLTSLPVLKKVWDNPADEIFNEL